MSKPKTTKTAKAEAAQQPVADAVEQKEASALEQQEQAATETAAQDVQEPVVPAESAQQPAEPLDAYIARVERAKLDQDIVVVEITHPEVHADRVHPGTYGGIRLSNGPVGVTYSDGTKA